MVELSPFSLWILLAFIVGYACITIEHVIKVNKATVALMMGAVCWAFVFAYRFCPDESNTDCFLRHVAEISQIILFLIGALTIVELIDLHQGFRVISDYINVGSKRILLAVIGVITFFLSAILDNLTTTIVMVSLLQRLIRPSQERLLLGAGVVIAANAGGAWTPIGDVTTTMLWIGGKLTAGHIISSLVIPSIVSVIVSLFILGFTLRGSFEKQQIQYTKQLPSMGNIMLYLGAGALVFVPVFKMVTGLPPFMGVLFGLSALWIITDIVHGQEEGSEHLKVPKALSKIDLSSVLFFLGILLCIAALDSAKILEYTALWLDNHVGNTVVIATFIGLISAVVDNVPLVAASMGMYDLAHHPIDSQFWDLVAYCAGTGGSILIIGSAAGVVYMGLEKVDFYWYLKRVSFAALVGYLAGIGVYLIT